MQDVLLLLLALHNRALHTFRIRPNFYASLIAEKVYSVSFGFYKENEADHLSPARRVDDCVKIDLDEDEKDCTRLDRGRLGCCG